jgi:hypothetical protein
MRYGWAALSGVLLAICTHSAIADSDYDVTLNTSSLVGMNAILAFDFIAGGGTQNNSLIISEFSTNGALGVAGPNSGSVSGTFPGSVSLSTLSGSSFFNEALQGLTLGSTITFQVDATTNVPTGGSLPDTFSLFLLDPTASYSLTNTKDPTGSDSLTTVQIDGTKGGNLGVYSGSGPAVPMTVTAVTGTGPTQVPEIDASSAMSALILLLCVLAAIRGRRIEVPLH